MVSKILSNTFLFRLFSQEDMEKILSIAEPVNYEQGQTIFMQDESSTAMFFLKYGSVRISRQTSSGDDLSMAVLGTGSNFGEMSFVDGSRRAATATALEHTEAIRIDFDRLKELFEAFPTLASKFHQAVAQTLATRLRATTCDSVPAKARVTLPL